MNNYVPHPIDTSQITIDKNLLKLSESLARNVHEVWAAGRMADGWIYGSERNDERKEHPGLVPYEELSEDEKDYDRNTALETLKLVMSLGFEIIKK